MLEPLQHLNPASNFKPDIGFKKYAKCMIFGEHAVLRDGHALLSPVKSKYIEFTFQNTNESFEFINCPNSSFKIDFRIEEVLSKICKIGRIDREAIKGRLNCGFHMPLGCGLGSSAVISVGFGNLLAELELIEREKIYHFACELENYFHGKSSGADVAGVYYKKPILFKNRQSIHSFDFKQKPILMLSHSGSYGQTQFCIERVENLRRANRLKADTIDEHMIQATNIAVKAFQMDQFEIAKSDLIEALQLGHSCFEDWGLVNHKVSEHVRSLYQLGAKACKLTGAGDGGYVLSLWDEFPLSDKFVFVPLFEVL